MDRNWCLLIGVIISIVVIVVVKCAYDAGWIAFENYVNLP